MTTAHSDLLLPGYWVDDGSRIFEREGGIGPTGAWCSLPWPTDPNEKLRIVRGSLGPQIIDWSEGRTDEPGLVHYMTGRLWRWTAG